MKSDKSYFVTFLRIFGRIFPGDYLKTIVYLYFIAKPRKFLRSILWSFYRMDHIYEVLSEFKKNYEGKCSVLEFGTADGYSLTKMLFATKYLKIEDRVIVHGFDSWEGMPESLDERDQDLISGDNWTKGQFKTDFENLESYCSDRYSNYKLHRGYFENTITKEFLGTIETYLPILIWIDCDYYTSAKIVFERLIPHIPSGCVIYFDEPEFNFGSHFTGESRVIHEINKGMFGDGIELVLDSNLSLNTRRVYRFINAQNHLQYKRKFPARATSPLRRRSGGSPFP